MELLGGCAMNEINICKEVGAKIRYFRKLQGYTLESFATILHRSKSVLSQYERGEISIDLLTLQQISNALGVSIGALIDNYWNASNLLPTKFPWKICGRSTYIRTFPTQKRRSLERINYATTRVRPMRPSTHIPQRN